MFVVAGASGHVGSVVANQLLAAGEKVRAIVRDAAKGAALQKKGAELAVGSLEDTAFLAGALKGAAGFFVLCPPNAQVEEFYAYQRKVTDAVGAAVKQSGVPHVVLLSSIGADQADGTGPIKGLHHLENVLRATGTKLTAIRPSYFQENAGNSVGAAKATGNYYNMTPSADYAMPMIATRDIGLLAAAELLVPAPKSDVVDLLGPSYSNRQVAELLGTAIGKKLQIVDVPPQAQAGALQQAGLKKQLAEAYAEMNAGFATGRILPVGDRQKVGRTPLEETIKTLVG